jgi:hypothetical protein
MKTKTLILFSLAALIASTGCVVVKSEGPIGGSGDRITRNAEPEPFDQLVIDRAFKYIEVEVCDDCEPAVEVQGDEVQVDDVGITSDGDTLRLRGPKRLVITSTDLTATVTTSSLSKLVNSGTADVEATGIQTEVFEVVNSGSGDVTLEGLVSVLDVVMSGSGALNALDLQADTVEVTSSGSGDADVCARGLLRGQLTGSGDLSYDCSPEDTDVTTIGSGDVSIR